MRYQVPQFIDIEDHIIGPFTIKQFIYIAGGAGLSFIIYSFLDNILLSVVPIIIVMAISVSLAFVKIHGKPLIAMVEAAVKYYFGDKLYVWRKEDKPATPTTPKEEIEKAKSYAGVMVPKISNSKLKDLTWSLDIKESMYTKMDQK